MARENLNPFKIAQAQFERAAEVLGLDAGTRKVLSTPKRELSVSMPVRMDDGRTTVVTQKDLDGVREGGYVRVYNGRAWVR